MRIGKRQQGTRAADLKSLTHSRQNRFQGLQIESGTRILGLLVPITFRSPRKGFAAMERGLRKVGTSPISGNLAEQLVNPSAENWLNCPINRRTPVKSQPPSTTAERPSRPLCQNRRN